MNYHLTPIEDLELGDKRNDEFFSSIRALYYDMKIKAEGDYLNRNILNYNIHYLEKEFELTLYASRAQFRVNDVINFAILNNDEEYISCYGYFTNIVITHMIDSINADIFTQSQTPIPGVLHDFSYEEQDEKYVIKIRFFCPFINPVVDRVIFYNLQMRLDNPNDREMFRITEIHPLWGTLCLLSRFDF